MNIRTGFTAISTAVLIGGNPVCPEPYLHKGNVIQFAGTSKFKGGDMSYTNISLEIVAVTENDGKRSAKGELTYYGSEHPKDYVYNVKFACDSLNFYAQTTNWFYISKDPADNFSMEYSGDSIIYPLSMKVGDSLPAAHACRKSHAKYDESTENTEFHHRRVTSHDTLDLPFGKVSAFFIEGIMSSVTDADFADGSEKKTKGSYVLVEWFSPVYGLVKREYRYDGGYERVEMVKPYPPAAKLPNDK